MIALAVCAVRERVRLATGDVSRKGMLCDLVRLAMGSTGIRGVGLSGGFIEFVCIGGIPDYGELGVFAQLPVL